MSCRVLIICEDPTHDQFILKPLVERILKDCGKSAADVQVCWNPRLRGFDDARRALEQICEDYARFDLRLFVVDNDGQDRSARFGHIEETHGPRLICCAAVEEVEAWLLAGHIEKLDRPWAEVRNDVSVKENVFAGFLRQYGNARMLSGVRDLLMKQTLASYSGLLERCPELKLFRDRVCASLAAARGTG